MRYIKPLAGVTVLMATSAGFAAPPLNAAPALKATKKAAATPTTINCAVVPDDKVNIQAATKAKLYADYKGNRYFFCCLGCPAKFMKTPAKFAHSAHLKTPASVGSAAKK